MSNEAPTIDLALLRDVRDSVLADWVKQLDLQIEAATPDEVTLRLPVTPRHVHGGGVLCGQTMMAACDTAMVLAISARLSGFKPMTTVQLQTSFLRPVAGDAGTVKLIARVLRLGKNLVFGEVELFNQRDELAAHATTTYALL